MKPCFISGDFLKLTKPKQFDGIETFDRTAGESKKMSKRLQSIVTILGAFESSPKGIYLKNKNGKKLYVCSHFDLASVFDEKSGLVSNHEIRIRIPGNSVNIFIIDSYELNIYDIMNSLIQHGLYVKDNSLTRFYYSELCQIADEQ